MNEAAIANTLYGGGVGAEAPAVAANAPARAAEAHAPAPPPASDPHADLTAKFYPPAEAAKVDVPPQIAKLRESNDTAESALYPDPPPHSEIKAAVAALKDDPIATQIPAGEWQKVAHDVGAVGDDVTLAVTTIRRMAANPPTDDEINANNAASLAELDRVFGDEAPQVLARTRALFKRDPRLADQLERSGAGSDPKVVLAFAHLAQREHARKRL